MAASETSHGYQCQFIDSVAEDFYCKQCGLVAREVVIASCCTESYCKGCIQAVKQDNKPCPGCGEESFEFISHVKNKRKISTLNIYCSLKERGCGWSGPLASLETHLDPDTGDCEYTDVACPLKCGQKVSKKTLEYHTAKECVQRDYVCRHCAFKATYKIVTEIHLPKCSYYSMDCPNHCGVAFERPTLEDHMRMCPLEEVVCQFEHVGCSGKFRREEEEEHMREKSQTHLVMMAAACAKMQLNLEKQEKRFEEQEQKFEQKLEEQERKFEERLDEQERKFEEKAKEMKLSIERLARVDSSYYKFVLQGFGRVGYSSAPSVLQSPVVYTHVGGYKFCIDVDIEKSMTTATVGTSRGAWWEASGVKISLNTLPGDYDDVLQWPVTITVTLELLNHFKGGKNRQIILRKIANKPEGEKSSLTTSLELSTQPITRSQTFTASTNFFTKPTPPNFIPKSELELNQAKCTQFLKNDSLHFEITKIEFKHN